MDKAINTGIEMNGSKTCPVCGKPLRYKSTTTTGGIETSWYCICGYMESTVKPYPFIGGTGTW